MTDIVREALRHSEEFLSRLPELPVLRAPDASAIRERLRSRYPFEEPVAAGELIEDVTRMLEEWSVHSIHPRYFGYFNPTPLPEAVAGDLLAAAFNSQLAVWSHAPAAVEMEQHVLGWLAERFGLPSATSAGHFTTGGAEANLTAVIAALTARFPEYGDRGMQSLSTHPTLYHSKGAHDSFTKICHVTGLGREALRVVPVDGHGRMDVAALADMMDADRSRGDTPFMAVATAGTTAAGIIDPLGAVIDTCRERRAWAHVDAAWGGAAILSPKLRAHLAGIDRADSITCDAHKWFNVTMGAGMFFCRDAHVTEEAFRVTTDYMPSLTQDVVDPYVTSLQWSRRFIGLKLFLALAAKGGRGYAEMIEGQATMGEYLERRLEQEGWIHVTRTPLPVSCVTHPAIDDGRTSVDRALTAVLDRGRVWISKVRLGSRFALRACITSRLTTRDDVDALVEEMTAAVVG